MDHQVGLIVEPDEFGNPTTDWIVYRAPAGAPEWLAAIAVHTRPAMIEMMNFAVAVLETIRPVVQPRTTGLTLPAIPDAVPALDDALKTVHRHLLGLRTFGGLVYPWDATIQKANRVTPPPQGEAAT